MSILGNNGSFSGAHPGFWPIRSSTKSLLYVSTLNFGPPSTKLGGTVRVIKKMTHNDNGPEKTLETLRIEWSTCLLVLLHVLDGYWLYGLLSKKWDGVDG